MDRLWRILSLGVGDKVFGFLFVCLFKFPLADSRAKVEAKSQIYIPSTHFLKSLFLTKKLL